MPLIHPPLWNSAHRPVVYRYDHQQHYFAAVGSNGGNAQVVLSLPSNASHYTVGGSCYIPSGVYAGSHIVLSKFGNSITINTPYVSGTNGYIAATPNVTVQLYAGYQIGHYGYNDHPFRKIADIVGITNANGYIEFRVDGYLRSIFKEIQFPRIGADFRMSSPFRLIVSGEQQFDRYVENGVLTALQLSSFDSNHKILNETEPVHFNNGKVVYSMIWPDTAEHGEHIFNIAGVQGSGTLDGIGYWAIGSTFQVS
ncbi:MAG: hypothetical protein ACPG5W_10205 [Flavobacteriales bacterium]